MIEADIQRDIIQYIESCDGIAIRVNSGRARHNIRLAPEGTPDLLAVLHDHRVLWIEVKQPGKPLRTEQAAMHTRLPVSWTAGDCCNVCGRCGGGDNRVWVVW